MAAPHVCGQQELGRKKLIPISYDLKGQMELSSAAAYYSFDYDHHHRDCDAEDDDVDILNANANNGVIGRTL